MFLRTAFSFTEVLPLCGSETWLENFHSGKVFLLPIGLGWLESGASSSTARNMSAHGQGPHRAAESSNSFVVLSAMLGSGGVERPPPPEPKYEYASPEGTFGEQSYLFEKTGAASSNLGMGSLGGYERGTGTAAALHQQQQRPTLGHSYEMEQAGYQERGNGGYTRGGGYNEGGFSRPILGSGKLVNKIILTSFSQQTSSHFESR